MKSRREEPRPQGVRAAFLFGANRSGTNMTVSAFAQSAAIESVNEDDPRAFVDWMLLPLALLHDLVSATTASVVLFKPINETYRAKELLDEFEGAKAIFIFRHYDDCVNSLVRHAAGHGEPGAYNAIVDSWITLDFAGFGPNRPGEETCRLVRALAVAPLSHESAAALFWLCWNRLYFDLRLDADERVTLVEYQTLVSDPERGFRRLARHLDIDFVPQMVGHVHTRSIRRNEQPPIEPRIRSQCDELWKRLCGALPSERSD